MSRSIFEVVYDHQLIKSTDYKKIISAHTKITFKKGDLFLRAGEVAEEYLLIESGLIRKYVYNAEGDEITTRFYSRHDFSIVVVSFFQRIPSVENVVAVSSGVAWKINFTSFQELVYSIKGFGKWGRNWMSGQLFISEQRSIDILTKTATDRYLDLMNERPEVIRQASLKHIASYLGIPETSLSRSRKEISRK